MRRIKNKTLRYLGIALIVIGIIIIAYPFYTNFVMKRRESDVLNSWENQINLGTSIQATTQTTTDVLTGNDPQEPDQSGSTSQSQATQSGDQPQSGDTGASVGPFDLS